jgi:hypothetical protein
LIIEAIKREGNMNYYGLTMGTIMILAIGLGHIIVIKWEYYWGARTWPGMLIIGVGLIIASFFADNTYLAGGLGIFGAMLLWGIHELFKQRRRVAKGLFPRKPGR